MTDDTKADAFRSVLIWVALTIVILTAPSWLSAIEQAFEPKPVLVECKRWM